MGIAKIIHWWFSPKLPARHIHIENPPDKILPFLRVYFRNILVHPIKRHLTHWYSRLLQKKGCRIIGITGSMGKTTTKEMIFNVLAQKYKTVRTPSNIDPVYNIPATVLSTPLSTQRLVLEMSIEYPGEMDFYLWLAKPNVSIVTNISWVHAEFLGSIEKIAEEKGKIVKYLDRFSYAILNADDRRVKALASQTKARVVFFSIEKKADVWADNISTTLDLKTKFRLHIKKQKVDIELPVLGSHFVFSALAAAAVGSIENVPIHSIKQGLETFKPQPHRMQVYRLASGAFLIDDSYNANPDAVIAAVDTLKRLDAKRKILVLGDMKELGQYEKRGHRKVGEFIVGRVDWLFTIGDLAHLIKAGAVEKGFEKSKIKHFALQKTLIKHLRGFLKSGDLIIVKGSRSMKMEEVVEALLKG